MVGYDCTTYQANSGCFQFSLSINNFDSILSSPIWNQIKLNYNLYIYIYMYIYILLYLTIQIILFFTCVKNYKWKNVRNEIIWVSREWSDV